MNALHRNGKHKAEDQSASGRFPVRMPRYLHDQLKQVAKAQGVSLNQFVCTAAVMAAGLSSDTSPSANASGGDRVSDEEFSRIWWEILA